MKYLLDTCAIIWLAAETEKLSKETLGRLIHPKAKVCVSSISAAEIACAIDRGRLELDRHWKSWFRFIIKENNWEVISISLPIIEEAWSLPGEFHADPADRVIVGTARNIDLEIVTGDKRILNYPHVESLC